jgi:Tfp pilus assembly protein PilV
MLNCSKDTRGLSLIEALLAVAILIIGILSIINIFPVVVKISRTAEQETVAANLAQAKFEEIFSWGYDNTPLGEIEAKHRLASTSSNPFYFYQRQTVSTYVDGNLADSATPTGLKKITVTVFWTSPHLGSERNTTVYVLISQR